MYIDATYCYRLSSMVCRSVTIVSPAKMAELIAVPFGVRARVGPRNSALDGSRSPHAKGQFLGGKDMPRHA